MATSEYRVIVDDDRGFNVYGGNRDFWHSMSHESVLAGPAETGKTRTALEKVNLLCLNYPGLRALMCRKTYRSLVETACVTFEKKVLGAWSDGEFRQDATPVIKFGGESPRHYQYPNGSRIVLAGLDKPGKILSGEFDVVFAPQLEELSMDEYEIITTRATGRAGNLPFGAFIMGDANPGPPFHWILERRREGKLEFFESRHEDNPTLFDPVTGEMTEQGRRTMAALDKLTGVRKSRLREGKWVQAEGAIYESFDRSLHVINPFPIPAEWPRFRVIDFGYVNPFVCQWWALDGDRRAYMYREIYHTKRIVSQHAEQIKALSKGERIVATICDHDAEDRATLAACGIPSAPAYKAVSRGIEAVQRRLQKQDDGKPRLFFFNNALVEIDPLLVEARKPTCTEEEIESYIWENHKTKEAPRKENDHGCDGKRYFVAHIDNLAVRKVRKIIRR